MDSNLENVILKLAKEERILEQSLIQELWSGYGKLLRLRFKNRNLILKLIQYPKIIEHPKGWIGHYAHQRKIKSYQVETSWYKNYQNHKTYAYTAKYIGSGKHDETQFLLIEDLKDLNFQPQGQITQSQIELCINWLASFHAFYLDTPPTDLWKIGSYWNLSTRTEEFESLKDHELIKAAPIVNSVLNNSNYQTLIHGDAKLANFLFSKNSVSAVDFQYIGAGIGVKDLMYFLSSIYNTDQLYEHESFCLDFYFKELTSAIKKFKPHLDPTPIENEWRELYAYTWCDFYRFLSGWSPGHYKINKYTTEMKSRVLNDIK